MTLPHPSQRLGGWVNPDSGVLVVLTRNKARLDRLWMRFYADACKLGLLTVAYEYIDKSLACRVMRFTDFEGLHECEDEDECVEQC